MWFDPQLLALCESLKRKGRNGRFRPGSRIARGFADVGFEEFVILPNGKTMSLFTGAQAEFLDEHRGFFFEVPSVEELLGELELRGEKISSVVFFEQRAWRVATNTTSAESRSLQEALILCLLQSYDGAPTEVVSGDLNV